MPSTVKPRARNSATVGAEPLVASCAQHQRGAGLGQPLGHLLSQSARSAGDDGDAAGQIEQLVDGAQGQGHILNDRYGRSVNCSGALCNGDACKHHHRGRRRAISRRFTRRRRDLHSRGPDRGAASLRPDRRRVHRKKKSSRVVKQLYAHDWALTRRADEEGQRARFAPPRGAGGVRRARPRPDQRVVRRRADRHRSVVRRIARRAHVDRHAAARLLRHRRAEGALSAEAWKRRADRRVRAHRAASRLGRAGIAARPRRSRPTAVTTCSTARRCGSPTAASPICSPSSPR